MTPETAILLKGIDDNKEWLQTTNEDEVECISIENLRGLLYEFNPKIKEAMEGFAKTEAITYPHPTEVTCPECFKGKINQITPHDAACPRCGQGFNKQEGSNSLRYS